MNINERHSVVGLPSEEYNITKNPREIFLLRGNGCKWKKCRFCDYHLDFSLDENDNFKLNSKVLEYLTGKFSCIEIINSGSFSDLDEKTMALIKAKCIEKKIEQIHFECHWNDRNNIQQLKNDFKKIGVTVKIKIGVETFDKLFRESYLIKGIDESSPEIIAEYADEVCLLQGIPGQTAESMLTDIKIGLKYFERVCINIMCENSKPIKPDFRVIKIFKDLIYPTYVKNPRVDILFTNTDFGVGE
ncbi:MAG: radical SAM protein [Oscillospiraceae bacterium]